MNYHQLDAFTSAYIECALWSSITENGHPVDDECGIEDIEDDSLKAMVEDCKAFQTAYGELFDGVESQAGHDYWLTRNGHGAGFWDREDSIYPECVRKFLTRISHEAGELYLMADTKEDGSKVVYVD